MAAWIGVVGILGTLALSLFALLYPAKEVRRLGRLRYGIDSPKFVVFFRALGLFLLLAATLAAYSLWQGRPVF